MTCSSCAAALAPGAKFCSECGTPQSASCPTCGAAVTSGRFCSECGTALVAIPVAPGPAGALPAVPPVATAPVAERRLTTLLFADLVGFTPLSEGRDPETVRELLSVYFERTRAVIERYGGTVEKFIGDAVFAVWGVPTTREDDAELAVRAGLDLVSTVSALGLEQGVEGLSLRVGITTGQVAVTLGAVGEGMVAGDAVNTAARVQSAAEPGTVWVDDTTRSLTTAAIAYEGTGSHVLKGKAVPVDLFEALRTVSGVGGDQRVDGLEAPFVGRDRELRLVKELFHATAEERRGRLVLVVGEPGIGKSRLAWEFEKYLDAITSATTFWMRARCLSYGQGVAGRVVAELVRSLLRVSADDPQAVRVALEDRLTRSVADETDRDVLRPRLLALLGLSDAVFEQADLFACWRGFLEALTANGSSVTVLVEDLQWADDGFYAFLEHLLEAARAPVMVLALARPEVSQRRPGIGAGRGSTTVFLDPLPDAAMARLLDGLVSDLPAALRDELVRRADGIPLYAVETVRSLVDRDVVVPRGGRYVVDREALGRLDLTALSAPASLQALLAARLDALTAPERRVVQDASVLGLSFTREGLSSLTPAGTDLEPVLAALCRKEILAVDSDPRSSERGQLRFVQALLRGVAYQTLSRRDRKARHVAVAEHVAGLAEAGALSAVLAAHWLDAAAAVPEDPDAGALRARGVEQLERAAEHAAEVGAPGDALGHFEQLLGLEPPDEVEARCVARAVTLRLRIGTDLAVLGPLVERGLAAAGRADDAEGLLRLRQLRVELRVAMGDRAPDVADDALAVLLECRGRPDRLALALEAARTATLFQQYTGDADRAAEVGLLGLAEVERYGTDAQFLRYLDTLSTWFGLAGFRRLAGVVRLASTEELDDRDPAGVSGWVNLAVGELHDDPARGVGSAERGLRVAQELGVQNLPAIGHIVYGCTVTGQWGRAREVLQVPALGDLADWRTYITAASGTLAWASDDRDLMPPAVPGVELLVDDPLVQSWEAARAAAEQALAGDLSGAAARAAAGVVDLMAVSPASEDVPPLLWLAVDLLLAADDRAGLARLVERVEQLPPGQRYRLLEAQLQRARAHLAPDPVPGLRSAVELLDAMGARYVADATRVELAVALAGAGDHDGSAEVAARAEPLLRELGAVRGLAALSDLRSRLPV